MNQPHAPAPRRLRTRQAVSTVDPKARMTRSRPILAPFIQDLRASRFRAKATSSSTPHTTRVRPRTSGSGLNGQAMAAIAGLALQRPAEKDHAHGDQDEGPVPDQRAQMEPPEVVQEEEHAHGGEADAPARRFDVVLVRQGAGPARIDEGG